MSVDCFVFLRDERLPSIKEWQDALTRAKTGIVLEPIEDLRTHTGYLPAKFKGHESGFEWYYGPTVDVFGEVPAETGDRFHAVNFVTHSDIRELICGMIAGAVLARLADGLAFDEESGEFVNGERALEIAKQAETEHL